MGGGFIVALYCWRVNMGWLWYLGVLLARYPIGMVVPFTLLVPVVGIIGSILTLGEPFQLWKLMSGLLVMTGLYINLAGSRFFKVKVQQEAF